MTCLDCTEPLSIEDQRLQHDLCTSCAEQEDDRPDYVQTVCTRCMARLPEEAESANAAVRCAGANDDRREGARDRGAPDRRR